MSALRQLSRHAVGLGLSTLLLLPAVGARAGDGDEHEFHRHHVGVFLGAASRPENDHHHSDEHGFAGGIEYEYRFAKAAGVGVLAEAATGDLRDVVVVGLVFIHPWRGLQIAAGAGAEISSHDSEFVTRLGAAYEFEIGERFTISPNFNADLVNGDPTYVYGITFGVGF
jgi:hypothetical protein